MRLYRERLTAPASWWIAGLGCAFIFGTLTWAGFTVAIGLYVYLVLGLLVALALIRWGWMVVEVTADGVSAGPKQLPIDQVSDVSALDDEQTTALRGPRADPESFMVIRAYLPKSVYIGIAGRPAGQPYWLIASRRPAELAEAIETARSRAGLETRVQ
jgi:hypothetical protein